MSEKTDGEALSEFEKKKKLFLDQKELLDTFLSKNAISRAQYEKSLHDLTEKMGMSDVLKENTVQ